MFYQLLAGLSAKERDQLHLTLEVEQFRLLGQSGCITINGVDDAAEFRRTRAAMEATFDGGGAYDRLLGLVPLHPIYDYRPHLHAAGLDLLEVRPTRLLGRGPAWFWTLVARKPDANLNPQEA